MTTNILFFLALLLWCSGESHQACGFSISRSSTLNDKVNQEHRRLDKQVIRWDNEPDITVKKRISFPSFVYTAPSPSPSSATSTPTTQPTIAFILDPTNAIQFGTFVPTNKIVEQSSLTSDVPSLAPSKAPSQRPVAKPFSIIASPSAFVDATHYSDNTGFLLPGISVFMDAAIIETFQRVLGAFLNENIYLEGAYGTVVAKVLVLGQTLVASNSLSGKLKSADLNVAISIEADVAAGNLPGYSFSEVISRTFSDWGYLLRQELISASPFFASLANTNIPSSSPSFKPTTLSPDSPSTYPSVTQSLTKLMASNVPSSSPSLHLLPGTFSRTLSVNFTIALIGLNTTMDANNIAAFDQTVEIFLQENITPASENIVSVTSVSVVAQSITTESEPTTTLVITFQVNVIVFADEMSALQLAALISVTFLRDVAQFLASLREASPFFSAFVGSQILLSLPSQPLIHTPPSTATSQVPSTPMAIGSRHTSRPVVAGSSAPNFTPVVAQVPSDAPSIVPSLLPSKVQDASVSSHFPSLGSSLQPNTITAAQGSDYPSRSPSKLTNSGTPSTVHSVHTRPPSPVALNPAPSNPSTSGLLSNAPFFTPSVKPQRSKPTVSRPSPSTTSKGSHSPTTQQSSTAPSTAPSTTPSSQVVFGSGSFKPSDSVLPSDAPSMNPSVHPSSTKFSGFPGHLSLPPVLQPAISTQSQTPSVPGQGTIPTATSSPGKGTYKPNSNGVRSYLPSLIPSVEPSTKSSGVSGHIGSVESNAPSMPVVTGRGSSKPSGNAFPSDTPSTTPSIRPSSAEFSNVPGHLPSRPEHQPSSPTILQGSDYPSQLPSILRRSTIPAATSSVGNGSYKPNWNGVRSDLPSLIPSVEPSTNSGGGSDNQTVPPTFSRESSSLTPSVQTAPLMPFQSDGPSLTPSLKPSILLSSISASSDLPSHSPSFHRQHNKLPSMTPSVTLSPFQAATSDSPSFIPTHQPSLHALTGSTSDVPSTSPSISPSPFNSAVTPSDSPSILPSLHPSLWSSLPGSSNPHVSDTPSVVPSVNPTASARVYSTSHFLSLSGITTPMNASDQEAFENAVMIFLTKYVTTSKGLNVTFEGATVFHQDISNTTRRRLHQRGLNVYFSVVAIVFPGDPKKFNLAKTMKNTFDKFGSDFFSILSKSSSLFSAGSNPEITQQVGPSGTSTKIHGAIYVSVAAATITVVLAIVAGIWVRRRRRSNHQQSTLDIKPCNDELDTCAGQITSYPPSPCFLEKRGGSTNASSNESSESSEHQPPDNGNLGDVLVAPHSKTLYLTSYTHSMSLDNGYEEESEVSSLSSAVTPASPNSIEEGRRASKSRASNQRAPSKRESPSMLLAPIPELAASSSAGSENSRSDEDAAVQEMSDYVAVAGDNNRNFRDSSSTGMYWGNGIHLEADDDIVYFSESPGVNSLTPKIRHTSKPEPTEHIREHSSDRQNLFFRSNSLAKSNNEAKDHEGQSVDTPNHLFELCGPPFFSPGPTTRSSAAP